jgi:hypothetical protein
MKSLVLQHGLAEPVRKIRSSIASIIAKMAHEDWPEEWPDLMPSLLAIQLSDSVCLNLLHAILAVLSGILRAIC